MMNLRSEIEKSLDELISHEEGFRFQRLAIVFAKEKWPGLIASEIKKDQGLDAHEPQLLASDGSGKGLACSLTPTLDKIKKDIQKIHHQTRDISVLIFLTPHPITNHKAHLWANIIQEKYSIKLILISREDIISDLMRPLNASICRNLLKIPVEVESDISTLLQKVRASRLYLQIILSAL